jgi:hypothetical protein
MDKVQKHNHCNNIPSLQTFGMEMFSHGMLLPDFLNYDSLGKALVCVSLNYGFV